MKDLEVNNYLDRIRVDDCSSDLLGLSRLQESHMENIPFENLDITVGREIKLGYQHLYEKVIQSERGGYCFELNTLYSKLLKALGFCVKPVLGRVWLSNPRHTPPRNHLAYIVKLEGRNYITDVGFGGLVTRIPLDIDSSTTVIEKDGMVRILPFSGDQLMVQRKGNRGWENQYSFDNMEASEKEIYTANEYMSTSPRSHFCRHKFVGINTKEGRIGLFNDKISIRKGINVVTKNRVEYGKDWLESIDANFSLSPNFTKSELSILFR